MAILRFTLSIKSTRIFILFMWMFILFHTSFSAISAQQPLKFQELTNINDLYENPSYSIAQDKEGFIWVATQDGLNRYDGTHFVQYRKDTANARSLADNFVRKVFIDSSNTLWVGTENGLSKYNKNTNDFDNFYQSSTNKNSLADNLIWDIYQDSDNNLLVSTEYGLHQYDATKNEFITITIEPLEKDLMAIKTIYQDENNNYWLGTFDNGIYITDENFNNAFNLQTNNPWALKIPSKRLFDIEFIDGLYWLGTNNGLYIINEKYKLLAHLTTDNSSSYFIENLPANLSYLKHKVLFSNTIRSIAKVGKQIWLATEKNLNIIEQHHQSVDSSVPIKVVKSLTSKQIMDIFIDKNRNVWIASLQNINFFNKNQLYVEHHLYNELESNEEIEAIVETTNEKIWMLSSLSGLNYIDKDNNISQIPLTAPLPYYDLTSYRNNLWFIASDEQLYQYNTATKELFKHEYWSSESDFKVSSSLLINHEFIWFIDNQENLVKYSKAKQSFTRYKLSNNSTIHTIALQNNIIYATTSLNDIVTFNINDGELSLINIHDVNDFLISAANQIKASNNKLWLGSTSQGLAVIDLITNKIDVYNESNTLNDNYINAILPSDNDVWLSTNKGITYLSLEDESSVAFYEGFTLNDNVFIEKVGLRSTRNQYFFGGRNGINIFVPKNLLSIENHINKPILTNLLVKNKSVEINNKENGNTTLLRSIEKSNLIHLTYNQSPFSIEFTSPNNLLPERIKYRYKLTGLDKQWIDAGSNNRRATYTNLSSGKYTFEVEVFDRYNPKNKQSTLLIIKVHPPWWSSNAAIFSYSIFVFFIIAYFIQQLRHKEQYNIQIKTSEERLKLSLWGSGDEMWDWNITEGKIYRSNIWGSLDFPQDGERNIGREESNIHINDLARVKSKLKQHIEKDIEHFEVTYRIQDNNEQWFWVLDRGKVVEHIDGKPSRMTGTLKNISNIKKAEEKLKLFAKCIESISDAIVIYDRQFEIVDVNNAYLTLTNKTKAQLVGSYMHFSEYSTRFNQNIKKHLLTKDNWQGELQQKNENGEQYTTEINIDIIHDEHGKTSHFVAVLSDITLRKKNEVELRKLANTDTLTELPNRSFFQSNQMRLVENKTPHALLVFDLDNFKKINDSMGHELGDILLCELAKRMLDIKRLKDTVYRLGGDEFSMIIEDTNDIHTITSIAKDILRTVAIPLKPRNQEIVLYSSIGIALYPDDGLNSEELLKNADTAMYHAKGLGGNKYQFFSESMNKQAVKRLQIENLIRYGLKEDYFAVFYQPKIEIKTGKVSGMEALVRFITPTNGIISPGVFIPVSEETGQIVEIGEVVLRKACYTTKEWVDAGLFDGRVAVNLSAVQFSQPNLVSLIAQILLESALPAKHLELEITEGTVMDSPKAAIETMLQIRAMGIHLSLDDFGTGYSSLAYLKRFPLNTLKIDKAFVDDIEESTQGRNMVATIVTIAHNLGLHVVAEGVETENQLSFLSSLECEQLQGFLYSKPLEHQDFTNYLLSHQITDKSTAFNVQ